MPDKDGNRSNPYRCGECKHWTPQKDEHHAGFGYCERISDDCGPGTLAYAFGGDEGSWISTKSEFGCVLFEVKDAR